MKINIFGCDHPRCKETVAVWLSVDLALKGWVMKYDYTTYCPKHRERYYPNAYDTDTTDNYLAWHGYPRKEPTWPPRNFDRSTT